MEAESAQEREASATSHSRGPAGPRRRGTRAGLARTPRWAGPRAAGWPAGRTEGQRAALTMSSMVLSSITESGSMAAPAAPPRSLRSAANGPGGGGGGSGGGGGCSSTHSSCQPARAAGSSALPLVGRRTHSEDYNSRQPRRLSQLCGSKKPLRPISQGSATGESTQGSAGLEVRDVQTWSIYGLPGIGPRERCDYLSQKSSRARSPSGWSFLTSWQPVASRTRTETPRQLLTCLRSLRCDRFPHMRSRCLRCPLGD